MFSLSWAAHYINLHLHETNPFCDLILDMECMNCDLIVSEEIVLKLLKNPNTKSKYKEFLFNDQVKVCVLMHITGD